MPARFASLLILLLSNCISLAASGLTAADLRCEYWPEPQNVDVPHPRLSWVLSSDGRDEAPTGYQILVASTAENLARNLGDRWDTGKVASDRNAQISYEGKQLVAGEKCLWKVRVWNKDDRPSAWSEQTTWSMGLLKPEDWKAVWITTAGAGKADQVVKPLPIFRKTFVLFKPVAHAELHICGLGQYELRLNGKKVGDSVLDPGWTDYRKACLYQSYDLTNLLHSGGNTFGVMLGNGMYNVQKTKGRYTKFVGADQAPKLIAQLEVAYDDGTFQTIDTDTSWQTAGGPITFSSIYGGEDYDARLEIPGWDRDQGKADQWQAAVQTTGPGGVLKGVSQSAPPIVDTGLLKAKNITHSRPDAWVYDLGQNCAQMPSITLSGKPGMAIRITPAEVLRADGSVSQRPSGGPMWFSYTLGSDPSQTWSPRFCYYGSRYMQISGAVPAGMPNPDGLPIVTDLHGRFITSSSPTVGEFSCSNTMFNQTAEIIRWAMRSNMMSVLTDCPHREKLGWLEQNHLVGPSLMCNFQIPELFTKVCGDIADAQTTDGLVPDIAPEYTVFPDGFRDSPEWGSAAILIPWQMYEWYGDTEILARHFETMKRYVDYLGSKSTGHIVSHGLGDWYDLGPKPPGIAQLTPKSLTATAFYYRDITILQKSANLLGHDVDATKYAGLARSVRDAFNQTFYHADAHSYATGSQSANAIPLVFGMPPEADREAIVENIVQDVRRHDNGLTAGDVGYRYLLRALADGGRSDVIFDMNSRSDRPGYGMILARGATSLTEAWDARLDASQDHFMLGHIMEWFYSDLAGIQQSASSTAFRKIMIKPTPVGDVTWARASYKSISGIIQSSWQMKGNEFDLDVTIPPGCTATVFLPRAYGASVTENGQAIESVSDLNIQKDRSIQTGSGHFHFVASK